MSSSNDVAERPVSCVFRIEGASDSDPNQPPTPIRPPPLIPTEVSHHDGLLGAAKEVGWYGAKGRFQVTDS
jgi:hypothetical protein